MTVIAFASHKSSSAAQTFVEAMTHILLELKPEALGRVERDDLVAKLPTIEAYIRNPLASTAVDVVRFLDLSAEERTAAAFWLIKTQCVYMRWRIIALDASLSGATKMPMKSDMRDRQEIFLVVKTLVDSLLEA